MKGMRRAVVPPNLGRTYDLLHASLVSQERSLVSGRRANVVDPRERRVRRRCGGFASRRELALNYLLTKLTYEVGIGHGCCHSTAAPPAAREAGRRRPRSSGEKALLQHGKSDPPTQTPYPPRAQGAGHPRPLATPLPTPSTPARVIDDLALTTRPPQADARLAAVSRAEHFVRGPRLSPVDPSVGRLIGGRACTKSALLLATMPCASPEAAS